MPKKVEPSGGEKAEVTKKQKKNMLQPQKKKKAGRKNSVRRQEHGEKS